MPRRFFRHLIAISLAALGLICVLPNQASAGGAPSSGKRGIVVAQIDGLIDPANAELIANTIRDANRARASLIVLKINSGGTVDVNIKLLLRAISESGVPIGVWIGPAGAKAKGVGALLASVAPVNGVSNDSGIGPAYPVLLDYPTAMSSEEVSDELKRLNESNGRSAAGASALTHRQLTDSQAARLKATNSVCPEVPGCPTLGDFIVNLDGTVVTTATGAKTLNTAKVVGVGDDRRRQPNQVIAFRKLDLVGQATHTLTSPSIAYLLLVVGLSLIVFEFFTISIGLAGGAGAIAVVGAFVGFSHLPVTLWALLLILFAMFGYAIDVQAGKPYAWTVIATALLIAGSLFLYGGSGRLDVYWWVLLIVVISTVTFMVAAMPVAVRSRFSTPTIGREGLIGDRGIAVVDVAPDGVVEIRGARWRARTNRATPIRAGETVVVGEVDGLVLEVEPEEGAARDYRNPRKTDTETPQDSS